MKCSLHVGQKFCSVRELETAKKINEDRHFCELWKRDVRTLASATKRVPKRVVSANPDIAYYSQKLSCKFGGKTVETREKRKRKTKSFRQVYISMSGDGKHLQVKRISEAHNHIIKSSQI